MDDALAIALAVRSPELELLGVSTVFKNTPLRAQLALHLLKLLGREDIPVAVGTGLPIRHEIDPSERPHQCRELTETLPPNCRLHAVQMLIETVRNHPDVTIVGIGPFTNLALAIRLAPEVMNSAHIVVMGGAVGAVYPEWNILCDPEAANILFRSGANVEMVSLDATVHCVLPAEDLRFISQSAGQAERFLSSLVDIWMDTSAGKKITLHDPLTVAYLADPTLLQMERMPLMVEMEGTCARYSTVSLRTPFRQRTAPPPDNVNVSVGVDTERIRRIVMERVFRRERFESCY